MAVSALVKAGLAAKNIGRKMAENWKLIAVVLGVLILTGWGKNILNKLKFWKNMAGYDDPGSNQFDARYQAMILHDALDGWLFFGRKDKKAIAIVNAFQSNQQFGQVVYEYAQVYSTDLRAELRKRLNDREYGQLIYR